MIWRLIAGVAALSLVSSALAQSSSHVPLPAAGESETVSPEVARRIAERLAQRQARSKKAEETLKQIEDLLKKDEQLPEELRKYSEQLRQLKDHPALKDPQTREIIKQMIAKQQEESPRSGPPSPKEMEQLRRLVEKLPKPPPRTRVPEPIEELKRPSEKQPSDGQPREARPGQQPAETPKDGQPGVPNQPLPPRDPKNPPQSEQPPLRDPQKPNNPQKPNDPQTPQQPMAEPPRLEREPMPPAQPAEPPAQPAEPPANRATGLEDTPPAPTRPESPILPYEDKKPTDPRLDRLTDQLTKRLPEALRNSDALRKSMENLSKSALQKAQEQSQNGSSTLSEQMRKWEEMFRQAKQLANRSLGGQESLERNLAPRIESLIQNAKVTSQATNNATAAATTLAPSAAATGAGTGFLFTLAVIVAAILIVVMLQMLFGGPLFRGKKPPPVPIVNPTKISTPQEFVRAFEFVTLQHCGPPAQAWHHRDMARGLGEAEPSTVATAERLAQLYALVRYTPEGDQPSPAEVLAVRDDLKSLVKAEKS